MTHRTVKDVMSSPVLTVRVDTHFKDIVRVLDDHRITALPVLDGEGTVVGIVSQTDLLHKEEYQEGAPHGLRIGRAARTARTKADADTAGDLMTAPAVTVGPHASLPEAARLMAARKVTRLPVVDAGGALVGIVSRGDLLGVFLRPDDAIAAEVLLEVFERVLWVDPRAFPIEVRDGVVTLVGHLEQKSLVSIAVRLTRAVDGVVDVVDKLSYAVDDNRVRPTITRSV